MNGWIRGCLCAGALALAGGVSAAGPRFVFLFIGDGMSMPQRMVAQEFAVAHGYGPLAMNGLTHQCTTRTRSANSVITDSAAAATAIACGEKTNNGMLGVRPDGTTRLESVAEVAHRLGRRVGIMTTVTIVHATPAGFYAHQSSRGQSYRIALDLVNSGFEFFAGGGVGGKYNDVTDPFYRGNVFKLAEEAGYRVVTNRAGLASVAKTPGMKCWGVFSPEALPYAIDGYGDAPSLAEMTREAIRLLDNPDGFFMMCEGGRVDWAGHANDAATSLREIIVMDEAVKVACAFQEARPNDTLIVTTGDHETGGLSMGFAGTGGRFLVELLKDQTVSTDAFSREVRNLLKADGSVTFECLLPRVTAAYGLKFAGDAKDPLRVTDAERKELEKAFAADKALFTEGTKEVKQYNAKRKYRFANACRQILAAHAGIGWSSGSHTALPTITTAKGPGAERFTGFLENTDIARRLKDLYLGK